MGNSPLVSYTKISPNKNSPRNHVIDTITIHHVVGQLDVETIGAIFAPTSRQGSCNYCIGKDGRIGLIVDEKDRSWCSSSPANDHRAITIEVANNATAPYAVSQVVYDALIDLLVDICQRHKDTIPRLRWVNDPSLIGQIDKQNMTVHRWFTPTLCPGDWLFARMGTIATTVNNRLDAAEKAAAEEEAAKQEEIKKEETSTENFHENFLSSWNIFRKNLKDNDASDYSSDARKWAIENKIITGTGLLNPNYMWEDFLTREQFVAMLYRYDEYLKKQLSTTILDTYSKDLINKLSGK